MKQWRPVLLICYYEILENLCSDTVCSLKTKCNINSTPIYEAAKRESNEERTAKKKKRLYSK